MPTENRSSNTELSKIVTEALVGMVSGVTGMKPPPGEALPGFIQAPIDRAVTRISGFVTQPAPQPHPDPIAWMVGTAIWWTKEEAERDAAETGPTIVGLGPMAGIAPVVQRQEEPLPITNDMHRLMEACRIGEFKDEGGSETVEALAVASLDAKSSMGHDDDSYMAGYSAALYEQAEPFIWMSLSSQRQGDPSEVERLLSERKRMDAALVACSNERDELRKANTEFEDQVASDFKFIDDLRSQLAELQSSVREFLRIDGISVDGSAARNKALTMLNAALAGKS